ncbi:MAG TPA: hypothetical protein VK879_05850 [Candidatus Sulfomarinibacteraceae bacterium]|nr:hypothetical protein [Candidatus Sulfomarinibacteraceae bacterium]
MATSEERRKILEMLAEGRISTAEAAELLSGVEAESATKGHETHTHVAPVAEKPLAAKDADKRPPRDPRWLHIRVADLRSGERKVEVNIPLQLIKIGAQMGSGFSPEFDKIDWDLLDSSLAGEEGRALVDIRDDAEGEHVQIYVD